NFFAISTVGSMIFFSFILQNSFLQGVPLHVWEHRRRRPVKMIISCTILRLKYSTAPPICQIPPALLAGSSRIFSCEILLFDCFFCFYFCTKEKQGFPNIGETLPILFVSSGQKPLS